MKPTKQAKPVKAWMRLSDKHGLVGRAHTDREAMERVYPVVDGALIHDAELVRVEIRVIGGKK